MKVMYSKVEAQNNQVSETKTYRASKFLGCVFGISNSHRSLYLVNEGDV